jgi:hypothetical protein
MQGFLGYSELTREMTRAEEIKKKIAACFKGVHAVSGAYRHAEELLEQYANSYGERAEQEKLLSLVVEAYVCEHNRLENKFAS